MLSLTIGGYKESTIKEGSIVFKSLPKLSLEVSWVLKEPRPIPRQILNSLYEQSSNQ